MDIASIWNGLADAIAAIPRGSLLWLALGALLIGWLGTALIRRRAPFGKLLSGASTLILVGILVTVVLQLSRFDPRFEMAVPELGLPEQVVEGSETRVEMAPDGHFWLRAEMNGVPANFLVDTGATLTAVNAGLAEEAGLQPRRGGIPIQLNTANGTIAAQLSSVDELRFGNVAARGLDAVIAPNLGETNVIGMNVLSRLQSWRVEGRTLVLVPNNPQPELVSDW
ncbi:TIGR02281 family clan AA aspartic protease [Altererythrobacter sp. MF3-039]|uniref:retropepsin-like aspartic protease family protein n=1 Tax=Altererythrobacter sp. MF3-039 TaxID=3252901 RepID=UPI00390C7ABE